MLEDNSRSRSRLLLATNGIQFSTRYEVAEKSREIVLNAVQRKFGILPSSAYSHESFELEHASVAAEKLKVDSLDLWALRYIKPDDNTPGGEWRVEIVSADLGSEVRFACRILCRSNDFNFSFVPSTPAELKDVVDQVGIYSSGALFSAEPEVLDTDEALSELESILNNKDRWWNVIVISRVDGQVVFNSKDIASRVMGVANVYILPEGREKDFIGIVGQDFNVYGGAARTFRRKFSSSDSDILSHPVIASSRARNDERRATEILVSDAFRVSIERPGVQVEVPSFIQIRQHASQARLSILVSDDASLSLRLQEAEASMAAAKEEVETAVDLGRQAEEDKTIIQEELILERSINYDLKQRIEWLESRIPEENFGEHTDKPNNYQEVPDWIQKVFAGKLRLHPRARRSIKDAEYGNIEDVIEGLSFLASEYRNLQIGKATKQETDERLRGIGMDISGSITPSRAGEQADRYFVNHSGRKVFLENHLKKGTSREPRYCMRIYFFFDEEISEVVVGWLPGHLNNRLT